MTSSMCDATPLESQSSRRHKTETAIMSNQHDQEAFLSSLHEAQELTIVLTEHLSPKSGSTIEMEEVMFRLEMSSNARTTSQEGQRAGGAAASPRVVNASCLERDILCHSNSTWQLGLSNPVLAGLYGVLSGLREHHASCSNLRSVTLQGCGRIPGFYCELIAILSQHAASLESLFILDWGDFITSDLPEDAVMQYLYSRLKHFHVDLLDVPRITYDARTLALVLLFMPGLQTLHIRTTSLQTTDCAFLQYMGHALASLSQLHELQWMISSTSQSSPERTREHNDIPSLPSLMAEHHDHLLSFCSAIGSRPVLQTLQLSWPGLQPNHLAALLAAPFLTSLAIDHVNEGCATVIGKYLTHNKTLRTLTVAFDTCCSSSAIVLEGVVRHSSLTSLSLLSVNMNNDTSKAIQMVCVYNSMLVDLQVSTCGRMETRYLQDIIFGLKSSTSLRDVTLRNTGTKARPSITQMDPHTSLSLCDLLNSNTTLQRLSLQVELPSAECAIRIAGAIRTNATLKSLSGVYYLHTGGTPSDEHMLFSFALPSLIPANNSGSPG